MIHLTRALIRRWLGSLLHIDDTPQRTAAAFALGVSLGFSPFLGFHTLIALGLAFLLNLNRVAVLLGVYSNLPWILPAYYTFTTMLGAALTRTKLPPDLAASFRSLFELPMLSSAFWQRLGELLTPLLWPYTVGSSLGAILLGALAYPLALGFVTSRRRLHDILHHHPHHPPTDDKNK